MSDNERLSPIWLAGGVLETGRSVEIQSTYGGFRILVCGGEDADGAPLPPAIATISHVDGAGLAGWLFAWDNNDDE